MDIVFGFVGVDFVLVLIGYPKWKAYIKSALIDSSIEVIPQIDIIQKTIIIPERHVENDSKEKKGNFNKNYFNETELEQIENFFNLIPNEVFNLVKHFKDSHWETVKAIIQFGETLKPIFITNLSIAYLIVNLDKFNPSYSIYSNIDYINLILKSKQKKILELALFPSSEQIVKIFSKIDSELLSFQNFIQLRKVLHYDQRNNSKVIKLLSHQEKITPRCFDFIITNYQLNFLLSHNAVLELLQNDNYEENVIKLKKIKSYSKYLKLNYPLLKTIKNIDKVLNSVKMAEQKRREKEEKFPKPPIPGNDIIIPISNKRELKHWSNRQVNCIHSFSNSIKQKQCYLYKVILNGEEATLQINIQGDKIKLGSLLATRNKKVSLELHQTVLEWLKINKSSKKISPD